MNRLLSKHLRTLSNNRKEYRKLKKLYIRAKRSDLVVTLTAKSDLTGPLNLGEGPSDWKVRKGKAKGRRFYGAAKGF